jgi:hypothetical protein
MLHLAARMSEPFSQVIVTLRYPDLKCLGAPNAHYRSATQGAEFHTHTTSLSLQSGRKGPDIHTNQEPFGESDSYGTGGRR